MEEKYNQIDDENTSDTSEKSKTGLGTPEKKILPEPKKDTIEPSTAPKVEAKEEEDQDSDHEDPHGNQTLETNLRFVRKKICTS